MEIDNMVRKKVEKWDDGDSGKFTDGKRFRLSGVRAPEKNQRGGSTATRSAAGMTGQSKGRVNWTPVARDKYGREVGNMTNQHGSVNKRLIQRGSKNKGR